MLAWAADHGIPVIGRLEGDETADGGDTFWLRPDVFCIGRSLRTNMAGAARMAELVGGEVHVFDVPYANGPAECLHLMSVISPIADDLAVVFLPQLPAGLYELLARAVRRARPGARGGDPEPGLQHPRRPPGRGRHGRGQPGDAAGAARSRLRGAHVPRDRGVHQRVRRPDLHHPPDPAGMKNLTPAELAAVGAVDRDRIAADLAAIVAHPSLTGVRGRGADRDGAQDDDGRARGRARRRAGRGAGGRPGLPGRRGAARRAPGRGGPAGRRRERPAGGHRRPCRRGRRRRRAPVDVAAVRAADRRRPPVRARARAT